MTAMQSMYIECKPNRGQYPQYGHKKTAPTAPESTCRSGALAAMN